MFVRNSNYRSDATALTLSSGCIKYRSVPALDILGRDPGCITVETGYVLEHDLFLRIARRESRKYLQETFQIHRPGWQRM